MSPHPNDPAHDLTSGEIEWQYSLVRKYFDDGAGFLCYGCTHYIEGVDVYKCQCAVALEEHEPHACPAWSQIEAAAQRETERDGPVSGGVA